jgi:hypothetical protein
MIYIKFAADQRDGLLVRVCDAVASSQESLKRCRRSLRRINYFMLVAAWESMSSPACSPIVSSPGCRTKALPSATKWKTTAFRDCTANPHGPETRVRTNTRPVARTAFNQPFKACMTDAYREINCYVKAWFEHGPYVAGLLQ